MQDNLALAIKNLVLEKGINIPTSTPKSNVQDLKKPDLFSLTKETELFQNEKESQLNLIGLKIQN